MNLLCHGLNEDLFALSNHQSSFRKWLNSFWKARKNISLLKNNSQHLCFGKKAKGKKILLRNFVFTTDKWNLTGGGVACVEVWVLSFLWQSSNKLCIYSLEMYISAAKFIGASLHFFFFIFLVITALVNIQKNPFSRQAFYKSSLQHTLCHFTVTKTKNNIWINPYQRSHLDHYSIGHTHPWELLESKTRVRTPLD